MVHQLLSTTSTDIPFAAVSYTHLGAVAGEKFEELFFANCKDEKIAEYVKTLR